MGWWTPNGKSYNRIRQAVLHTYGETCYLCGGQIMDGEWSIDHVIPRSKGGTHDLWNLRPMHKRCNYSKGNRPMPRRTPKASRKW